MNKHVNKVQEATGRAEAITLVVNKINNNT